MEPPGRAVNNRKRPIPSASSILLTGGTLLNPRLSPMDGENQSLQRPERTGPRRVLSLRVRSRSQPSPLEKRAIPSLDPLVGADEDWLLYDMPCHRFLHLCFRGLP